MGRALAIIYLLAQAVVQSWYIGIGNLTVSLAFPTAISSLCTQLSWCPGEEPSSLIIRVYREWGKRERGNSVEIPWNDQSIPWKDQSITWKDRGLPPPQNHFETSMI